MHTCPLCGDCDYSSENGCTYEREIEPMQAKPFERPTLPDDLRLGVVRMAKKINDTPNHHIRATYLIAILSENALLTAEVNQHRATLGFELLPVYDPMTGKVKK